VIFLDFILDVVGYTTARLLLPTLTFQKVKVDVLSSDEIGFNWLGFKRLPNGALLCDADSAGWIGIVAHSTKSQGTPLRLTCRSVVSCLACCMDRPFQCISNASGLA